MITAKRGYLLGVGAAGVETTWLLFIGVTLVSTASAYGYTPKLLIPGVALLVVQAILLGRFALTARKISRYFRQATG